VQVVLLAAFLPAAVGIHQADRFYSRRLGRVHSLSPASPWTDPLHWLIILGMPVALRCEWRSGRNRGVEHPLAQDRLEGLALPRALPLWRGCRRGRGRHDSRHQPIELGRVVTVEPHTLRVRVYRSRAHGPLCPDAIHQRRGSRSFRSAGTGGSLRSEAGAPTPHPTSHVTPDPASRIPHPASRIPHPASRIPHPGLFSAIISGSCPAVRAGP
jgi:hypothetical protein